MLFSICIPSYNRPKELRNLLESIDCSHKYKFEVVICEDKSPKRFAIRKQVEEFKNSSEYQISYNENELNLGYDKNLRTLLNLANGKFIIFMGDDDAFVPNILDLYVDFLEQNLSSGYILRSYKNIYKNGSEERFQYFSTNMCFEPSSDTYVLLFDKSVFISGFTLNREYAMNYETDIFDGSLLYQLYLLAELTQKYPSAYFYEPLTQAYEGGIPFFGSSDAERELYTPGTISVQNSLNFMKWYIKIIDYIENKYQNKTKERILQNMSKYSYPVLAIQRNKGVGEFRRYTKELKVLGYNKSFYFYIYYWALLLLGKNNCDSIIRVLKKIIGRRPEL